MGKQKITIAPMISCIVIFLVVIYFSLQKAPEKLTLDNNDIARDASVTVSILSKQDEYNKDVRSDILNGNLGKLDSELIRNHLPKESNEVSPIIEFRSFERKLDGSIQPLFLETLGLLSQVPKGETLTGGNFGIDGYGLRLALSDNKDGLLFLIWDTEYTATGIYHLPEDPNNIFQGKTPELRFRTPKSIGPGEIYRVDLVLVDRNREYEIVR